MKIIFFAVQLALCLHQTLSLIEQVIDEICNWF